MLAVGPECRLSSLQSARLVPVWAQRLDPPWEDPTRFQSRVSPPPVTYFALTVPCPAVGRPGTRTSAISFPAFPGVTPSPISRITFLTTLSIGHVPLLTSRSISHLALFATLSVGLIALGAIVGLSFALGLTLVLTAGARGQPFFFVAGMLDLAFFFVPGVFGQAFFACPIPARLFPVH